MATNETLIRATEPLAQVLRPRHLIDVQRRVDQAIDDAGNVIQKAPPFLRLQSPDGSVWRLKVSNTGTITAAKAS